LTVFPFDVTMYPWGGVRSLLYRPKTVLNKGKRADHWFWSRYSAYPYVGCQHGCLFC
jgi:DNA repair photolyase